MSRYDEFDRQRLDRPSVYTLTDRQLADEYSKLTGASVHVPSSRNPAAWWQWRCSLQEKVRRERDSERSCYLSH
jgi:hypothetical protein